MADPYSSFASGLLGGYNVMTDIADRRNRNKVQESISRLSVIQKEQEIKSEQAKQALFNFNSSFEKGTKYLEIGQRIKDPSRYQEYISKMSTLPFFEKSPSAVKTMLTSVGSVSASDAKQWLSITNDFKKAQKENDTDSMMSFLYEGYALYGDNPMMKPFLDFASKSISSQDPETSLGKHLQEQQRLPEGDPRRKLYEQQIATDIAPKKSQSRSMHINPETGEVTILEGEATGQKTPFTRTVQTTVQKRLLDAGDSLVKLRNIRESFNKDYFSAKSRLRAILLNRKEAWTGTELTGEDKTFVDGFKTFAKNVTAQSSQIINDLLGSAVTPREYDRLKTMLLTFSGDWKEIFTGDGITSFEAKLTSFEDDVTAYIARYNYMQDNGGFISNEGTRNMRVHDKDGNPISLNKIMDIVNETGNSLEAKFAKENPDMQKEEIDELVIFEIKNIFGI